ncbi:hypothetical protein BH09CHL1_BH09CHL1_32300 [soil metagenome]
MNSRLTRRAVAATSLGLAATRVNGPSANAAATPEASPTIDQTNTAAGQQLAWVLAVINGDVPIPTTEELTARFSAEMLGAVPVDQLQDIFQQFHDLYRPIILLGTDPSSTEYAQVSLAEARDGSQLLVSIQVAEKEPHQILGLKFEPYNASPEEIEPLASWEELETKLASVAPGYSIFASEVLPDGTLEPIHAVNESEFLAIGSAFKFYVLGAVAQKIAIGNASWSQPITVTDELKSFPSGKTQDEPDGTEIAIEELANRMMSISDNTATDMLLDFASRDAVEAALTTLGHSDPERTMPFLKTKEMFLLKLSGDTERLDAYANGELTERREILAAMEGEPLPALADVVDWTEPIAIDSIEWFATMPDLARAMVWLWGEAEKPGLDSIRSIITLNPGVPFDDSIWNSVAFKGGSEVGVMALSWRLERKDGRTFTFACAVNNPEAAIPENDIALAAAGAFALLADV